MDFKAILRGDKKEKMSQNDNWKSKSKHRFEPMECFRTLDLEVTEGIWSQPHSEIGPDSVILGVTTSVDENSTFTFR